MTDAPCSDDPRRAHHDMGGVAKFMCQSIDIEPHTLTPFDKRVDALRQLLSAKGLMSVDELRRGIEELSEAEYHALTYYERWIRSIRATLVRKGVVTEAQVQAALRTLTP